VSEIILILRRTEGDKIKMLIDPHVKWPLFVPDFNETSNFATDFRKKYSSTKFQENATNGNRVVPCGRTDRQA